METSAQAAASVSLGKGAWDCDSNTAIPPEKEVELLHGMILYIQLLRVILRPAVVNLVDAQAEVFEEIATMDFPFEGIPTVPPRKDMQHMVRWTARTSLRSGKDLHVLTLFTHCRASSAAAAGTESQPTLIGQQRG